jgi:endonuclease/exonuclease/phosphatase (EEP) superfamily protein YafD
MLFSRLELVDPQIEFLVQDDIPSIHTRVRLRNGQEINLHCLHPRPPVPNDGNERSTERDAELLIVGREIENDGEPNVVLGDLNDVAWSHTTHLFERISGLLDPRVGRVFYNSFHARHFFLRFPLDHLYHSNHFRLVDFKRLPAFGSDHFPMFVVLNFEPEATTEQAAEPETPGDEAEAEEKIEEVA